VWIGGLLWLPLVLRYRVPEEHAIEFELFPVFAEQYHSSSHAVPIFDYRMAPECDGYRLASACTSSHC
jgi:hypothetical protein